MDYISEYTTRQEIMALSFIIYILVLSMGLFLYFYYLEWCDIEESYERYKKVISLDNPQPVSDTHPILKKFIHQVSVEKNTPIRIGYIMKNAFRPLHNAFVHDNILYCSYKNTIQPFTNILKLEGNMNRVKWADHVCISIPINTTKKYYPLKDFLACKYNLCFI